MINQNTENQQEIFYDEELGKIELLKLKKDSYFYYINNVKGCENLTYYESRLKLHRNILCGRKMDTINGRTLYYYGNLAMIVANNERIVWIENYKNNYGIRHYINYELRDRLTKLFGIEDDKAKAVHNYDKNKIEEIKSDKKVVLLDCKEDESIIHKIQNKIFQTFGVNENLLKGESR